VGKIDVLLTDVVLPVFSGPELASRLKATRPEVLVLFMSGYPDDRIAGHDLHHGEPIGKPFTAEALTERVRATLDR
jgi:DNA-binding response OmpR family regulator